MTSIGSVQTLPARGGALAQVVAVRPLQGGGDIEGDGRQTAAVTVRATSSNATAADSAPTASLSGPNVTIIQQVSVGDIPAGTPGKDRAETPGPSPDDKDGDGVDDLSQPSGAAPGAPDVLSSGEQEQVRRLSDRDAAVRTEETSHRLLAGPNGGQISYSYQAGPDGRLYAVGGSVSLHPVQGLSGLNAISNQAAISRAAFVGTSDADRAAADSAGAAINNLLITQRQSATQAYQASAQPVSASQGGIVQESA